MTRAEEQESLFLVRQELEISMGEKNELSERLLISDTKCENLEQELKEKTSKVIKSDNRNSFNDSLILLKLEESYKAREDSEKQLKSKCKELETLKKKMKEVER